MQPWQLMQGDCLQVLATLPAESVQTCITSPPYWGLRDYGAEGQLGLEATPEAYVASMVAVFQEVRRVLRDDGTLWLNLGDSYATNGKSYPQRDTSGGFSGRDKGTRGEQGYSNASGAMFEKFIPKGLKPKDLVGIPWRVAFALQADGWYLRSDIIWHKPNPMPESVTDRPTKAHEYLFLLTKSERYYYDAEAIKEPAAYFGKDARSGKGNIRYEGKRTKGEACANGQQSFVTINEARNKRTVWTVPTSPYSGAHFATFPPNLITPCILAGCPVQCCPKCGKGWERISESTKTFESGSGKSGNPIVGKQNLTASDTNSTPDIRKGPCVQTRTIGFRPACDCGETATIPGTVLDPFGGSGTTGMVAYEHGRSAVLVELSKEYAKLIDQRLTTTGGLCLSA